MLTQTLLLVATCVLSQTSVAAYKVDLPYHVSVQPVTDFKNSSGIALEKPLLAYYSIPYAQAPVGKLRYELPVAPQNGKPMLLNNTDYGNVCSQPIPNPPVPQGEDCLTLSIFKPQSTYGGEPLPVVIWTPGGSFNTGGGRGLNVPSMVGNAPQDFIGVSINYRLGAFGSLPSSLSYRAGLLNLGLQDQLQAYKWVQEYIQLFGGDPNRVTIFGESAGAHAVGAHLQHVGSEPNFKPPFNQVIMDSGGSTARAWANWTYPLYECQMQEFLNRTGCNVGDDEKKTFKCLRNVDAEIIRNASATMYAEYSRPAIRWPFQPVVDGQYVKQSPTQSWRDGSFNKVPVLTGFNTDEGSVWVPMNYNTTAQFRSLFASLLPLANSTVLDTLEALYPDPVTDSSSPYVNSPQSPQYLRLSAAYGDFAYISTAKENAQSLAKGGVPVWKYHFNYTATPQSPIGVNHGSELAYLSRVSPAPIAKVMNTYYSSFIVSGNPNTFIPSGYNQWPTYDLSNPQQLTFQGPGTEVKPDTIRAKQIAFWLSIPEVAPH
ncbi:hypothetical protein QFC21_006200 [Naganishia friedmannii]|uniref:Uncharacterized protein n=1 Tax=Naganishia friedmannii TaxID=89922 RepID=A0ACC2V4I4_9TREE|nr:hypothetical protein QFC21_006200 [Naganishia friedmannii]